MAKDFLEFEFQIELNERSLDKYHGLFEQTMGKISIITLLYSIIAIYAVQFVSFAIEKGNMYTFFSFCLLFLLIFLIVSIYYTFRFLLPIGISYLNSPKYFYTDIRKRYEIEKGIKRPEILNKYIQATYLNEIEKAVENNYMAFKRKRRLFYNAFKFGLLTFIPYLLCLAMYLSYKEEEKTHKVEIVNLEAMQKKVDSRSKN